MKTMSNLNHYIIKKLISEKRAYAAVEIKLLLLEQQQI